MGMATRQTVEPLVRALLTFLALADGVLSLEGWARHHRSLHWAASVVMGLPPPARLAVALTLAAAALYLATRPKRAFGRILAVLAAMAACLSLGSGQQVLVLAGIGDAAAALIASPLWSEEGDPVSSRLGWSLLGVAVLGAMLSGWLLLSARRAPHPAPMFVLPLPLAFLAAVGGLALLDRNPSLPAHRDPGAALRLYLATARCGVAPFALMRDKRQFWSPGGEAFLAFGCAAGVALALGPAIGEPDAARRLHHEFRSACRRRGWRAAWYQLPEADAAELGGCWRLSIGREGLVDVAAFGLEGRRMANLRHQVTKARRLGVSAEVLPEAAVPSGTRAAMRELADELARRGPLGEMAFSVGRIDDPVDVERTVGVAHDAQGRLAGYVTWLWLPAARTVVLDEVKRAGGAPAGTVEHLITTCLQAFRGRAEVASLGIGPLTGGGWHLVAGLLRGLLGMRTASPGLSAFKAKFRPTWEPRYVVAEGPAHLPAVLLAAFLLHYPDLAHRARARLAFRRAL
jgi:lysylphosphatidylglycerol synthetase-like protein (DUF2156 family)